MTSIATPNTGYGSDAVPDNRRENVGVATEPTQAADTGPTATNVRDDGKVGFKEKVVAEAKIIRGTLLGKPEEKDFGHKILNQEVPADKETITTRGAAPQ